MGSVGTTSGMDCGTTFWTFADGISRFSGMQSKITQYIMSIQYECCQICEAIHTFKTFDFFSKLFARSKLFEAFGKFFFSESKKCHPINFFLSQDLVNIFVDVTNS